MMMRMIVEFTLRQIFSPWSHDPRPSHVQAAEPILKVIVLLLLIISTSFSVLCCFYDRFETSNMFVVCICSSRGFNSRSGQRSRHQLLFPSKHPSGGSWNKDGKIRQGFSHTHFLSTPSSRSSVVGSTSAFRCFLM